MYLISIYFDQKSDQTIQSLIHKVSLETRNESMREVPSHITISSFDTKNIDQVITRLEVCASKLKEGNIEWVSIGSFLPSVCFISPVLDEYLLNLSSCVYESIQDIEDLKISRVYRPYYWMPHTTIGKKLDSLQLRQAFEVLQNHFVPFKGKVIKIGLASTNPYTDIVVYELEEE